MHPPEWPKWKRLTVPCFGEDVEQLELLYSADESVRGYNYFGKLAVSIHESSIHLPSDPAIALLGFFSREMSAYIHQKNVYNSFIQRLQEPWRRGGGRENGKVSWAIL